MCRESGRHVKVMSVGGDEGEGVKKGGGWREGERDVLDRKK